MAITGLDELGLSLAALSAILAMWPEASLVAIPLAAKYVKYV